MTGGSSPTQVLWVPRRDAQNDSLLHSLCGRKVAFKRICRAARQDAEDVCRTLLPRGRQHGDRWLSTVKGGSRSQENVISVSLATGQWSELATGRAGDSFVHLAASVWRLDRWRAAVRLAERLGVDPFK